MEQKIKEMQKQIDELFEIVEMLKAENEARMIEIDYLKNLSERNKRKIRHISIWNND